MLQPKSVTHYFLLLWNFTRPHWWICYKKVIQYPCFVVVLEASSCSFRSCRAGTSVVRVLSWAKPCSASWDLRVVCIFLKKKVPPFGCSPRASCCLVQGAWGSLLEIALILHRKAPEHIPGFFLSCGLEVVCFEEVFWVMCAFWRKKCTHWV